METQIHELVPVVFAQNMGEAEQYRTLLESGEIPASIGDGTELAGTYTSLSRSVPVRVPQQYHSAATELVAAYQEAQEGGLQDEADLEDDDLYDEDDAEDDLDDDVDEDDLDDDDLDDDDDEDLDEEEDEELDDDDDDELGLDDDLLDSDEDLDDA